MKKLLIYLLMFVSIFLLASCNDINDVVDGLDDKTVELPTELEELEFEDMTFVYDGEVKSLPELDLPKGYTAKYYNNEQTEIGKHTVKVTIKDKNGDTVLTLKAKLIIVADEETEETPNPETPSVDLSYLEFEDRTYIYDGSVKSLPELVLPYGYTAKYYNNEQTEVGEYTVKVNIKNSEGELVLTLKAKLIIVADEKTPDETISYHVVGGYHNDWSDYTDDNQMYEISLDDLKYDYPELYANLETYDIKSIYVYENREFNYANQWESQVYVNGYLTYYDGGFTVKVVKALYDVYDEVTFVDRWNPDPKTSHVGNLTPDMLYMPEWVEENNGNGCWTDNPVVTAGAGLYTVVFVEYDRANNYYQPGYALGVIKTEDLSEDVPTITPIPGEKAPFTEEYYAHGAKSYVAASYEERAKILGILEKYAVKNNLTGLTLYENGEYVMYHPSVVKGSQIYIPGYGFGILSEGYLNADLEGETNALWKRYYHTFQTNDPLTINMMDNYGSITENLASYVSTSYFGIQMNESKDGYNWINVQSNSARPEAVNGTVYDGTTLATKYRFEVKVGSEYRYNTLTTNSTLATFNGREVALEDYLVPYKICYTQAYSKAYSSSTLLGAGAGSIKGLQDYCDSSAEGFNEVSWNKVGIKAYYENGKAYLEFEFNVPCNPFYAMYYLSNNMYSPVPAEFIETLGGGDFAEGVKVWGNHTDSGLTPVDTWLSTGPYTLERWDTDEQIVFKKNPYYNLEGEWHYQIEGIHVNILSAATSDPLAALKEFEANKLHACSIPLEKLAEYKDDDRTTTTVGSSTFKLNFNSCTQEEWVKLFGVEGTIMQTDEADYWNCEPFMSNDDFLKGISYSLNRAEFAAKIGKTPSNNYLGSGYLSDPENGIIYNDTEYHKEAMAELSEGTEYGYNLEFAKASFKKAAEDMISSGYYSYGDTVEIEIAWMNPSDEEKYHQYIKGYIEDAWNAANTGLTLNVTFWVGNQWSDVYYYKMMAGQFDIGFGSISGNTLNPLNFFEVLRSDNSSGYTLNWGCDTSVVSQDIYYDGMYWSFNSLWEAADKGGYFEKGQVVPAITVDDAATLTENADGTATLKVNYTTATAEGLEVKIDNAVVFAYVGATQSYSEESVAFTLADGVLTATLTAEQVAKYSDCVNAEGYVGLDVYFTYAVNGITYSTLHSAYFNW